MARPISLSPRWHLGALVSTLVIAGALMEAAPLLAYAADICPTAYAPATSYVLGGAQVTDTAFGCSIGIDASNVSVFTIDLRGAPAPATSRYANEASSVYFRDGFVRQRSAIKVYFPTEATAAGLIPINLELTGTTFEAGAGLQVYGSLPPLSSILITQNTFNIQPSPPASVPSWFVDVFAGVAFYPHQTDTLQLLGANSRVSMVGNTFNGVGDLTTTKASVGVSWRGGVRYELASTVNIRQNQFALTCASVLNQVLDAQACVVGIHMPATQFMNADGLFFAIDSNNFQITGGFAAAFPPITSTQGVGALASFTANTGVITTTGAIGTDFVSFGTVTATTDLRLNINSNDFSLVGTRACSIGFARMIPVDVIFDNGGQDTPTALGGASSIVVLLNEIRSTGCDIQLFLKRDHSITGSGRMVVNQNKFTRSDGGSGSPCVEINGAVSLAGGGVLSLSANSWDSSPRPSSDQLMGFGLSTTGSVSGPVGSLRACGNTLDGALLDTDAEVKAKCSQSIAALIVSSTCLNEDGDPETVQNTATTTSAVAPTTVTVIPPTTSAVPPTTVTGPATSITPSSAQPTSGSTTQSETTDSQPTSAIPTTSEIDPSSLSTTSDETLLTTISSTDISTTFETVNNTNPPTSTSRRPSLASGPPLSWMLVIAMGIASAILIC